MSTPERRLPAILMVDDEVNILNALTRELRVWATNKELELITAKSAGEALDTLRADPGRVRVVLSDLRMPGMKGSDLIVAIHNTWPDIVALLLTGYSELEEVMKAVKAGAFSYLLKPWDAEYLKAELDKALETWELRVSARENERRVAEELRWAGEMQKALLRPIPMNLEGVEFRSSYRPLAGLFCSGDYYDVISLGKTRYLMLTGDVAGHGVRGALVTAMLKSIIFPEFIRGRLSGAFSPGAFLSWLNERMTPDLQKTQGMLLAFSAILLDMGTMTLTCANAGLPHPCIMRKGVFQELPVAGSAIGFATSVMYSEHRERLMSGDLLLSYTDGLTELALQDGTVSVIPPSSLFASIASGADLHRRILSRALELSGAKDFSDDLTLLTAHVL